MDEDKLNQALYAKMLAEQEDYRSWLMEQPPADILLHAFEYNSREEILIAVESQQLPAPQAQALLDSPAPLTEVYQDYRNMDTDNIDTLWECVKVRANRLLETRQKEPVPI